MESVDNGNQIMVFTWAPFRCCNVGNCVAGDTGGAGVFSRMLDGRSMKIKPVKVEFAFVNVFDSYSNCSILSFL